MLVGDDSTQQAQDCGATATAAAPPYNCPAPVLRLVAVGAINSGPAANNTDFVGMTIRSISVRSPRPLSLPVGKVGLVANGSVYR